jgi:ribosome-associated protein
MTKPARKAHPGNLRKLNQQGVLDALRACESKKAGDLALLEMDKTASTFTDYFVICSGTNPRQIQAIADEVEQSLGRRGLHPLHIEGYKQAEWVLIDYVDFVVHIFSEASRKFYDLERLWKSARKIEPVTLRALPRTAGKTSLARTKTKKKKRSAAKKSRTSARKHH